MRDARIRRIVFAGLICCASALIGHTVAQACTAFCAVGEGQILVGNNEDWDNPRTKIWFLPAKPGSYGRVYTGFDDMTPQGGMNERGLWFDAFSAPPMKAAAGSDLPRFSGNIVDRAMAECSTVEEVVRLFSQYNRDFLVEAIYMFADASGDAVSIERNAIVRKSRRHFVQTNFHQSRSNGSEDGRFTTASEMLERAGEGISVDLFRRILAATHQKGNAPTLYSNIYDLRARTMHLYYFHDFDRVVTFNLADELKKGERVLDIPALFPRNAAAETFAARRKDATADRGQAAVVALFALPAILILAALYGVIRGGRRIRLGLSAVAGTIVMVVVMVGLVLLTQRDASRQWMEFAIGPASGRSASISTNTMRADGMTLKVMLATAYDVPSVRVIGPSWLAETRYSLKAVVGVDETESFRSLLQQELKNRLRLETHFEVRPFDVFVLSATDPSRLERSRGHKPAIWIQDRAVQVKEANMEELAGALQSILGKPVIDATGVTGSYNLEFGWDEDRATSVTAVLRDRFGLQLSPGKRDMEVLIVDSIRRDASLVLLAHIGRATRAAPPRLRRQISELLTIH